jgi:D-sedoheptulose 7-phosphate isomerase
MFVEDYLSETAEIANTVSREKIEEIVNLLVDVRKKNGRLFFLGVGGSAGNAGHAVNDFRKLAGFESYSPTDNVSELTARTNDEGWNTVFSGWLKVSNLNSNDCIFILSVGGGDRDRQVSVNLCDAIDYSHKIGSRIISIVGKSGGYAASHSNVCLVIPEVNSKHVTPHSESFQTVIWHLLVSHPRLQINGTKW